MLPKISLITPSYNQGQFLDTAVRSVLSQGYPHLEYLVLDGGSTDNSLEVLRSFGAAVQWVSRPDEGQTDALNQGFQQATGEIIGFLNADDVLAPNALWLIAGAFQQHPQVHWITGEYAIIDEMGVPRDHLTRWYKRQQRNILSRMPFSWPLILGSNNPLAQPSTFWRGAIHDQGEWLREDLDLVMDYEWWWRLYQVYGSPLVVPYTLSAFRVHADSKGGRLFAERLAEQYRVAREYGVPSAVLNFHSFHNQVVSWMQRQNIT